MNDTEYRERCRELEKNIHMLESEVNVLNNECEKLLDLKKRVERAADVFFWE